MQVIHNSKRKIISLGFQATFKEWNEDKKRLKRTVDNAEVKNIALRRYELLAQKIIDDAILAGKPIRVFNNGEMSRDFTYVGDIVEGIKRVMVGPPVYTTLSSGEVSVPSYAIYNIGKGQPVRLLDFIGMLEILLNKSAKKVFLSMQPGDIQNTFADVSGLQNDYGYYPKTELAEGLRNFVDWYADYYNIEESLTFQ